MSTLRGELAQRIEVVEGGAGDAGGDIRRARILVRVEDVTTIAEVRRSDREHPAELAAADDADGRPGPDHRFGSRSATDPVCAARHRSSRSLQSRIIAPR